MIFGDLLFRNIIIEIRKHLEIDDILNLGSTCRAQRKLLTNVKHIVLLKRSRKVIPNLGLFKNKTLRVDLFNGRKIGTTVNLVISIADQFPKFIVTITFIEVLSFRNEKHAVIYLDRYLTAAKDAFAIFDGKLEIVPFYAGEKPIIETKFKLRISGSTLTLSRADQLPMNGLVYITHKPFSYELLWQSVDRSTL